MEKERQATAPPVASTPVPSATTFMIGFCTSTTINRPLKPAASLDVILLEEKSRKTTEEGIATPSAVKSLKRPVRLDRHQIKILVSSWT